MERAIYIKDAKKAIILECPSEVGWGTASKGFSALVASPHRPLRNMLGK
jgi:hypothetical protein